jgi:hypothetical protein
MCIMQKLDLVYFVMGGIRHVARGVRFRVMGNRVKVLEYNRIEPINGRQLTSENSDYLRDKIAHAIVSGWKRSPVIQGKA